MKTILLFFILGFIFFNTAFSQTYTNVVVGEKNEAYKDSIINSEYPYALPLWGERATELGYDLPYSAGLGLNYLSQESDLIIDDLMVGAQ